MKFGVREAVDVVFRAKNDTKIGNVTFVKDEPVLYFDSLKTTTLEGTAETVYAQGGKGNPRLIAWEGDKTVTFTFEDALISELGISVLTGAGLIESGENSVVTTHMTTKLSAPAFGDTKTELSLDISGNIDDLGAGAALNTEEPIFAFVLDEHGNITKRLGKATTGATDTAIKFTIEEGEVKEGDIILLDYYVDLTSGARDIIIESNNFAGYYYIEGDTLFRRQDGKDVGAHLVIPNAKIQSNFTFTMAGSGDPSTFTFTADAFPGKIKGNKSTKVLSAIQIIDEIDAVLD